jgi:hypothetical protein
MALRKLCKLRFRQNKAAFRPPWVNWPVAGIDRSTSRKNPRGQMRLATMNATCVAFRSCQVAVRAVNLQNFDDLIRHWSTNPLAHWGKPEAGSSRSFRASPPSSNSNMLMSEPARASNDEPPIRPKFQLSSMNRRIEVWSVREWST